MTRDYFALSLPGPDDEDSGWQPAAAVEAPPAGEPSSGTATSEQEPGAPKVSQATQLVQLAASRYRLGLSERGEAFGVPHAGPRLARMLRGDRDSLRAELSAVFMAEHGKAPSSQALADAMLVLEGRAQSCDREPVALRVARHGGAVVLDLGDTDGNAAVVDRTGWTVGPSPVLFRRTQLTDPLPTPQAGGRLDDLWTLLNVAAADRPLVAAWLVMSLLADRPCPVLALTGEQGAAKTSAAKQIAGVVDSPDALRAPLRDLEGWIVAADASRIVGLDNLTRVAEWLSDAICRTVTGEALVRRRLYTDSGVSRVSFRRPVLLTAIDPGALRGDLADRLLSVELERIPEARRREDDELAGAWTDAHPRVLGALLDLTAGVLAVLPSVRPERLPRMADFARVLAAVDRVLGTDGLAGYRGQAGRLAADVIDADPVAVAVREHITQAGVWQGTAAELLHAVTPDQPPKGWPATPRGMTAALTRTAPALRAVGVTIDHLGPQGTDRRRLWHLAPERTGKQPSGPSAPSAQGADQRKHTSEGADGRRTVEPDRPQPSAQPSAPSQAADQHKRQAADGLNGPDGCSQHLSDDAPPEDPVDRIRSQTERLRERARQQGLDLGGAA